MPIGPLPDDVEDLGVTLVVGTIVAVFAWEFLTSNPILILLLGIVAVASGWWFLWR